MSKWMGAIRPRSGVYAAGDIIGHLGWLMWPPWAVQAVNGMFGHAEPIPIGAFPAVPIASLR